MRPYFGLRSYTDNGGHYDGQIGSEATPREWLAAMLECTAEWVRVLKPSGSIFVNLGDKYPGKQPGDWSRDTQPLNDHGKLGVPGYKSLPLTAQSQRDAKPVGWGNTRPKSLMGLPWRYALACMDDLGLILRRDIVWHKVNGLPESCKDRCRSSHEYLFHLVKQPRYYAAVDEIRTPHTQSTMTRGGGRNGLRVRRQPNPSGTLGKGRHDWEGGLNQLGSLPGSVWDIPEGEPAVRVILRAMAAGAIAIGEAERLLTPEPQDDDPSDVWAIPSQPLTVPAWLGVQHFAAFPCELPRRVILGWSPPGICVVCGEGRRPVTDKESQVMRPGEAKYLGVKDPLFDGVNRRHVAYINTLATITGYACACPEPTAPTRPAVVVDPFSGTGTTMLTASVLGRIGIGTDLSADYCRLARWRVRDPAERAKALQVPKPPPVPDGQGDLFDLTAGT